MRAVVLSDTHTSSRKVKKVINRLRPHLAPADHILHAGDITSLDLLQALEEFAPVTAVAGNMDGPEVRSRLPQKTIVELGGLKFGLTHGSGSPGGVAERVLAGFAGEPLDAIVFGHTHKALVEKRESLWMINPGSPTDWFFAPFQSLVVMDIGNGLDARIVRL